MLSPWPREDYPNCCVFLRLSEFALVAISCRLLTTPPSAYVSTATRLMTRLALLDQSKAHHRLQDVRRHGQVSRNIPGLFFVCCQCFKPCGASKKSSHSWKVTTLPKSESATVLRLQMDPNVKLLLASLVSVDIRRWAVKRWPDKGVQGPLCFSLFVCCHQ